MPPGCLAWGQSKCDCWARSPAAARRARGASGAPAAVAEQTTGFTAAGVGWVWFRECGAAGAQEERVRAACCCT
jgi:hypothetical protein